MCNALSDDNKIVPDPEKQDCMFKQGRCKACILLLLYALCTLFLLFRRIIDLFGWDALRWDFFYGVHDIQRHLFLIPVIFAAYNCGVRGVIIVTIVSTMTFLPRALFFPCCPGALIRVLVFSLVAGSVGVLIARLVTSVKRSRIQSG
jgi:hypothetical protein